MLAKFILMLLWAVWCFLHSLLISRAFVDRMRKLLGPRYGYYRLAYNIFSLVSLLPILYFQLQLEEKVIFAWHWPWNFLKYGLYAAAFLLFYGGWLVYDLSFMLGVKQVLHQGDEAGNNRAVFTTKGILAYVRHPWYSGAILVVWAFGDITDVSLITKVVLTGYILIGTMLEEKKLIAEIGEPYQAYRQRVPRFIPRKKAD